MASRKKKNPILSDQATDVSVSDPLCPESDQNQILVNDNNENNTVDVENTPDGGLQPDLLESKSSEDMMETNTTLDEGEPSGTEAEEKIEPMINLDSASSIQNVVKLYDKLKKSYHAFDAIEIDASQVNSIDTATLQLLVSLKKDAVKNHKQVNFFQPSARFIESARLLDLLDIFEIDYV